MVLPVLVKNMFRVSDTATKFAVYALWRLADPDFGLLPSMVSGYPNDSWFDSPSTSRR
jgi:hypothetical protein